ncbi:MAG: endonuclease [Bacteroidaceae bacterium]|nr:endonuclease [Bacteroidaceae bacterium]
MDKRENPYRKFFLYLLLIAWEHTISLHAQNSFSILSYNIENAFDTIHDEQKDDLEYCAEGERKWSKSRLYKKLKGVGKVIAAADKERPLDLVGLCEVENDSVMTYLTQRTPLKNIGYKYLMTNSNDKRGIDVALLYSPFTFHLIEKQELKMSMEEPATRDVLRATGTINNGDTLDVYVLHLPSRRGGAAAHNLSMKVVKTLCENIDSIRHFRQSPNMIVMGDFNAENNSKQIKYLTKENVFVNQTAGLKPGSYKYQGEWSLIDHILTYTTSLIPQKSHILNLPFLVEPDNTNGGEKPRRTYLGPIYKGGISDHLPVFTRFVFRKNLD